MYPFLRKAFPFQVTHALYRSFCLAIGMVRVRRIELTVTSIKSRVLNHLATPAYMVGSLGFEPRFHRLRVWSNNRYTISLYWPSARESNSVGCHATLVFKTSS